MIKLTQVERKWAKNFFNSFISYLAKTDLSWIKVDKGRNTYWTSTIMSLLGKMARKWGRKPYSHRHVGEYMVDMCWCKEGKRTCYTDTAIEEEWYDRDRNEFLKDFYKLVDFKAFLKVFIIAPHCKSLVQWLRDFNMIIKKNPVKLQQEVYLIIALEQDKDDLTKATAYIIDKYGNSEYLNTKVA